MEGLNASPETLGAVLSTCTLLLHPQFVDLLVK
jgi:hypothetical protein